MTLCCNLACFTSEHKCGASIYCVSSLFFIACGYYKEVLQWLFLSLSWLEWHRVIVDGGFRFRYVFYHVIGDGVLQFNMLRYSSVAASAHGFKSDEAELSRDVDSVALFWFLIISRSVSVLCVLIVWSVDHAVTIATSTSVHYLSVCTILCGKGVDSAVCTIFLLQFTVWSGSNHLFLVYAT